jgi:hypothetical protein
VRVETRRPKQPVTWIPDVLELFRQKGQLTSRELAAVAGRTRGGDAVTRCRQLGLPVEGVGFVNGSRLPRKLYALNPHPLWLALEEAVKQINRYALILNSREQSPQCRIFRNVAMWIERVQRTEKPKPKGRRKSLA